MDANPDGTQPARDPTLGGLYYPSTRTTRRLYELILQRRASISCDLTQAYELTNLLVSSYNTSIPYIEPEIDDLGEQMPSQ